MGSFMEHDKQKRMDDRPNPTNTDNIPKNYKISVHGFIRFELPLPTNVCWDQISDVLVLWVTPI
jgi:hypothetical protein